MAASFQVSYLKFKLFLLKTRYRLENESNMLIHCNKYCPLFSEKDRNKKDLNLLKLQMEVQKLRKSLYEHKKSNAKWIYTTSTSSTQTEADEYFRINSCTQTDNKNEYLKPLKRIATKTKAQGKYLYSSIRAIILNSKNEVEKSMPLTSGLYALGINSTLPIFNLELNTNNSYQLDDVGSKKRIKRKPVPILLTSGKHTYPKRNEFIRLNDSRHFKALKIVEEQQSLRKIAISNAHETYTKRNIKTLRFVFREKDS